MSTIKQLRKEHKKGKVIRRKAFGQIWSTMEDSFKKADNEWDKVEKALKIAEGLAVEHEHEVEEE